MKNIIYLRSGWNRMVFHGGKHLRNDHKWLFEKKAHSGNFFLNGRQPGKRYGISQISSGDNHMVAMRQTRRQP